MSSLVFFGGVVVIVTESSKYSKEKLNSSQKFSHCRNFRSNFYKNSVHRSNDWTIWLTFKKKSRLSILDNNWLFFKIKSMMVRMWSVGVWSLSIWRGDMARYLAGVTQGDSRYKKKEINKQERTSQSSLSVYSRDEA